MENDIHEFAVSLGKIVFVGAVFIALQAAMCISLAAAGNDVGVWMVCDSTGTGICQSDAFLSFSAWLQAML